MGNMTDPETEAELAALFGALRSERRTQQGSSARRFRRSLSVADRELILRKTDGRCHICGGPVTVDWQADHVLAHSAGGVHNPDNYLPAHVLCNNYRWDYLPTEFEYILKLGVWTKTQIKRRTPLGKSIAHAFLRHETSRRKRRRAEAV